MSLFDSHGNRAAADTLVLPQEMKTIDRRQFGKIAAAATAAVASTSVLANRAIAQDATPEGGEGGEGGPGLPPLPDGATLVAEGLWNPGDLAFGPDGTLYIAETGVSGGGEGPATGTPDPEATPVAGPAPLVAPQVSMVAPDGTQSVLTDAIGGVGIAYYDGEVYIVQGGTSVGMGLLPLEAENTLSAIDVETGDVRLVASLGEYEETENPDETDVNPNLYGVAIVEGTAYVTDAGGNTIYEVDTATGEFSLFAFVPDLTTLTGAEPDPEFGPRQAVPTSIVADESGTLQVGLLAEGWEGPVVLEYAADGQYIQGTSDLSMIVALAIGPDGLLYASQLTADFSGEMPAPGNVFRVNEDGTTEAVVEGLFFPHGITFDEDGNLFVAVNSIISGPDAPAGQVIRIDGIATV